LLTAYYAKGLKGEKKVPDGTTKDAGKNRPDDGSKSDLTVDESAGNKLH